MVFGQNWKEILAMEDNADSVIAQAALGEAEKYLNKILDQLAVKIRNQIADAFNSK